MQMERSAMQQRVNEALHSVADQRGELQGRTSELETAVRALQGHVTQMRTRDRLAMVTPLLRRERNKAVLSEPGETLAGCRRSSEK